MFQKDPSGKNVKNLLVNLVSTSVRKKASAQLRSGSLDSAFVFQQWIELICEDDYLRDISPSMASLEITEQEDASRKISPTQNLQNRSFEQRTKQLAIALIWLLEEPSSDSSLIGSHYSRILQFLSTSVTYLHATMLSCSTAMMEVTNDSMEQVVKAVVILLRKESKKEEAVRNCDLTAEKDPDPTNLNFLYSLQDSISNLLRQHNNQLLKLCSVNVEWHMRL